MKLHACFQPQNFLKRFSSQIQCKEPKLFVTTPIFYTNAPPHLGHYYSATIANTIFRYELLRNNWINLCHEKDQNGIIFSTGTDEHGTKIHKTAEKIDVSAKFENLFHSMKLNNTHFIRTTDEKHKRVVYWFWNRLMERKMIYKSCYSGWYDSNAEEFVPNYETIMDQQTDMDGNKIGVRKSNSASVHWVSEPTYVFRLNSTIADKIRTWLLQPECPICPSTATHHKDNSAMTKSKSETFVNLCLSYLEELSDKEISVSRSADRVPWALTVPNDSSQTIYVWFDALANYLTVSGLESLISQESSTDSNKNQNTIEKSKGELTFYWPPTYQVIGKDILKFHAVLWPALLLACDLDLPKKIICHSHWTIQGQKMSKSLANSIDPQILSGAKNGFGSHEGLTWALLKGGADITQDSNFNEQRLKDMVNADLANNLGNLWNRTAVLITKIRTNNVALFNQTYTSNQTFKDPWFNYFKGGLCSFPSSDLLQKSNHMVWNFQHFCSPNILRYDKALDAILSTLSSPCNARFEEIKPWTLFKKQEKNETSTLNETKNRTELWIQTQNLIEATMNALFFSSLLMLPFVPRLAHNLLTLIMSNSPQIMFPEILKCLMCKDSSNSQNYIIPPFELLKDKKFTQTILESLSCLLLSYNFEQNNSKNPNIMAKMWLNLTPTLFETSSTQMGDGPIISLSETHETTEKEKPRKIFYPRI